eukprot:1550190-Pleurochrysis_carterae.AAC.1
MHRARGGEERRVGPEGAAAAAPHRRRTLRFVRRVPSAQTGRRQEARDGLARAAEQHAAERVKRLRWCSLVVCRNDGRTSAAAASATASAAAFISPAGCSANAVAARTARSRLIPCGWQLLRLVTSKPVDTPRAGGLVDGSHPLRGVSSRAGGEADERAARGAARRVERALQEEREDVVDDATHGVGALVDDHHVGERDGPTRLRALKVIA